MRWIERAFSTDLEINVDPDEAHYWFKKEKIESGRKFECIDENCSAPLICANISKAGAECKRIRYFRSKSFDDHSDQCYLRKTSQEKNPNTSDSDSTTSQSAPQKAGLDILRVVPPQPRNHQAQQDIAPSVASGRSPKSASRNTRNRTGASGQYTVIRGRIYKYLELCEAGEHFNVEAARIRIEGDSRARSYGNFFVKVEGQDYNSLPEGPRIYWGLAWVNRLEKSGTYLASFVDDFQVVDEIHESSEPSSVNPTLFISDQGLQEQGRGSLRKGLSDAALKVRKDPSDPHSERKLPYPLFLLSKKPRIRRAEKQDSTGQLTQQTYLNFTVPDLRWVDLQDFSFLTSLEKALREFLVLEAEEARLGLS